MEKLPKYGLPHFYWARPPPNILVLLQSNVLYLRNHLNC